MEEERRVRSDELRRNFRSLISEVEHDGAHIVVCRYDTPAAVIVPLDWYEQAVGEFGRERPVPYPWLNHLPNVITRRP